MVVAVPVNGLWNGVFHLGHSDQRPSVKCAEAAWITKSGMHSALQFIVHYKSPAFFFLYVKKGWNNFNRTSLQN